MILYFADRSMNILGLASNTMVGGYEIANDSKVSEVDTGSQTLSFDIYYDNDTRSTIEKMAYVGNYILRYNEKYATYEHYTIIDSDLDTVSQVINIYAEGGGMDLLNDILSPFASSTEQSLTYYATEFLKGSGFTVGSDESLVNLQLEFTSYETVLARIQALAAYFGVEITFNYEIENLDIKSKTINFVQQTGKDDDVMLRMNREIKNLKIKRSVANLCTAVLPIGAVPEGSMACVSQTDSTGKNWYTWLKFGDDGNGKNIDDSPGSHNFIGLLWDQENPIETDTPSHYNWWRYRYNKVIVVKPSSSGLEYKERTSSDKKQYMWIMFADDEKGKNMSHTPISSSRYIGFAKKKSDSTKSNKAEDYTWDKYWGSDTKVLYLADGYDMSLSGGRTCWVKYADDLTGTNMSNSAKNKTCAGMVQAYSSTESSSASVYVWDRIDDNPLVEGGYVEFPFHLTGIKEAGKNTYTWIKWAEEADGTGFTDEPGKSYIGMAYGNSSFTPSKNPDDYRWYKSGGDSTPNTTLAGYRYDDGNYYVKGNLVVSREAMTKWSRYTYIGGAIIKKIDYDEIYQGPLFEKALADLKKYEEPEVNYDIELFYLPDNIGLGDRVNVVDDEGQVYVSARLLQITESECQDSVSVTLGEFLIKDSGISDKVIALAKAFENFQDTHPHYTWIVYATDFNGSNITTEPTEDHIFMGVAENKLVSTPDLSDPTIYTWSLIKGSDGTDGSLIAVSSQEPVVDETGVIPTYTFQLTSFPSDYRDNIKEGDVVFAGAYRYLVHSVSDTEVVCINQEDLKGEDGQDGKDGISAVTMRIDSSRGNLFKNSNINTVLSVNLFYEGQHITTSTQLHTILGATAYLEWKWKERDETEWHTVISTDSRLSDEGFQFRISAADFNEKIVLNCDLNYTF